MNHVINRDDVPGFLCLETRDGLIHIEKKLIDGGLVRVWCGIKVALWGSLNDDEEPPGVTAPADEGASCLGCIAAYDGGGS